MRDSVQIEGLAISFENVEGMPEALLVHLDGYVDTYNSKAFQRSMEKATMGGRAKLIFNFRKYQMISSCDS